MSDEIGSGYEFDALSRRIRLGSLEQDETLDRIRANLRKEARRKEDEKYGGPLLKEGECSCHAFGIV